MVAEVRSMTRRDREEMEFVYAESAPRIPYGHGLPPGFYEKNNLCTTCRRVYPKEITFCMKCGCQVRTKGRNRK